MTKYTPDQIRKAKRFRLSDNEYFHEDTVEGKWYELKTDVEGSVYHLDEGGFWWAHIKGDGSVDPSVEQSLACGFIEYDTETSPACLYCIHKVEPKGSGYNVQVFTSSEGVTELKRLAADSLKRLEIAELERKRADIDEKITKLKGEIR